MLSPPNHANYTPVTYLFIMAYFLPSFFQKRILRYALSRLELLETDDLGLDRLDIAWGRRSTVELRDIGVNLKVRAAFA